MLLAARRNVKLCDRAGLATAVGTPLLMAPDATAVDVDSFGVLLWMMATQRLNPYEDTDSPRALLAQVARATWAAAFVL